MGSLSLCCVSPHPPILVPEVGKGEVSKVAASAGALARLASEIAGIGPDTLVVMSPHSPVDSDAFIVKADREMTGSFRQFGAPQVRIQAPGDEDVVKVDLRDGVKVMTEADTWLLLRASGTEPLVRVYVEARTEGAFEKARKSAFRIVRGK